MDHKANPFKDWATIVDCGDIANTPFDKLEAMKQLSQGAAAVMAHKAKAQKISNVVRMITLGGDHTISKHANSDSATPSSLLLPALPLLRAIFPTWGPVAVLHFDSHLDTWDPKQMNGGSYNKHSAITHGTMLHLAHEEGLMSNDSNMHLGSRSMMFDESADLNNDVRCGFDYVLAREIDELGVSGIVERTLKRVGGQPVYISIDIDVLDPAFTPGKIQHPRTSGCVSIYTDSRNSDWYHRARRMVDAGSNHDTSGSCERGCKDHWGGPCGAHAGLR